jgi:Polysaccharide lyase
MATGRWVDFVARVKWHLTDGIVEVWMDGAKKVSATGINTWYSSGQTRVKPQLGYYRPKFPQTALFYLDAFKLGDSYGSVAPGG